MQIAKVEDQYKKFSELNKSDVLNLLEWVKTQPHLPEVNEFEAILFLHSCNCSVQLAKDTIELYYTTRTHCPEFFTSRDVLGKDILSTMEVMGISFLPKLTPQGYMCSIGKITDTDPSKFNFASSIKLYTLLFDLNIMENGANEGYVLVMDMKGCQLGHVARLGLLTMKKFLFYIQEAAPFKLKGFHFINTVSFMDKILSIMRPFLNQNFLDVLHLHPTMDTFYDFIPKEMLPKEYGGPLDNMDNLIAKSYNHLKESRDFFLNEEKTKRVDESKRPGKPKSASDIFGAEGSFKKLDID